MTPGIRALRESAALSEREHVVAVRVEGPDAFDVLDRLASGDLYAQSGRMRHTLLLREDGTPLADVYVCAGEDDFLLLAEGPSGADLLRHLAENAGGLRTTFRLLEDRAVLGVDGPFAWELLAEVVGPDALGLPYLTFYGTGELVCFRAGKTGEYGYDLLVPRHERDAWSARIEEVGRSFDVERCTLADLDQCALENWFFNPRREGRSGTTPLELQLQWRLSRRKEYVGSEALLARRRAGIRERLVCLVGPGPSAPGEALLFQDRPVGRVVNAGRCEPRRCWVVLGLVDITLAHAGIDGFETSGPTGRSPLCTVAPPVLRNRSLFVQPQRHSYQTRSEIDWPPFA